MALVAVSLGAARFFDFHQKPKEAIDTPVKLRLTLSSGSIIVMGGETQKHYKHGIPIQKKIEGGRISLTFRRIKQ